MITEPLMCNERPIIKVHKYELTMPTITKAALASASGSLGRPVLEHLISSNFTVTVLSREDSTSTFPTGVKVVKVDYTSEENLTAALRG